MTGAGATTVGFVLVIIAALSWAIANIIAKVAGATRDGNDRGVDMFALVVWSSLAAPLPLFAASYVFEGGPGGGGCRARHDLDAVGLRPLHELLRHALRPRYLERLLHRYPTAVIAPFALLIPVSGLVSGWLLLGESLAPLQAGGVALVLAGLAWNVFGAQARAWVASALD